MALEVAGDRRLRGCPVVLPNAGLDDVARLLDRPLRGTLAHPVLVVLLLLFLAGYTLPVPMAVKKLVARNDLAAKLALRLFVGPGLAADRELRTILIVTPARPEIFLGLWRNRHHWRRFVDRAGKVASPVVLVSGTDDPLASPGSTRSFATHLPTADVVVMQGLGHCVPLEAPEETIKMCTSLLV